MEKFELKYEILLRMKENVSMDPTVLEGDRNKNELAILELEEEGLVKAIHNECSQYGKIIIFSITNKGLIKQGKLLEKKSTPTTKKIAQCGKSAAQAFGSTLKDITIGVATGVITNMISDKTPKP